MTQDDRTETITDPAEIRATDDPDERTPNEVHVDESGCSCKTGPYRGFQRDPIDAACPKHGGPLRHGDGDVTVCHPDGSTSIIREPSEAEHLESLACAVASVTPCSCSAQRARAEAAEALDLHATAGEVARLRRNLTATAQDATDAKCARDAARREADQLRHLLGSHADGHRCTCTMTDPGVYHGDNMHPPEWEQDPWCPTHPHMPYVIEEHRKALARAEAAEAEVATLRANWRHVTKSLGYGDGVTEPQIGHVEFVAECERQFSEASEWRESQRWRDECHDAGHPDDEDCYEHDPALVLLTLRAKVAAAEALADQWADRKRSDGMSGNAWIGITLAGVAADLRAALATTGEGE